MALLPKLSLITSCYNAAATIERTLKSVENQDYPNLEYIIMDGGSTDGTLDIIERYRHLVAQLVSEPDDGPPDALNKGIRIATSDYIGFINADDAYEPGALREIGKMIAQGGGDAAAVYTGFFYKSGESIKGLYANTDYMSLTVKNATRPILFTFTAFYAARVFQRYGGFIQNRDDAYFCNDQEFMLRLALAGERSIGIGKPLMSVYADDETQSGGCDTVARIFDERLLLVDTLLAKDSISDVHKQALRQWQMQEATKKALWQFKRCQFAPMWQSGKFLYRRYNFAPVLYAAKFLTCLGALKLGLALSHGVRTDLR